MKINAERRICCYPELTDQLLQNDEWGDESDEHDATAGGHVDSTASDLAAGLCRDAERRQRAGRVW
jgi:hypothetical protein